MDTSIHTDIHTATLATVPVAQTRLIVTIIIIERIQELSNIAESSSDTGLETLRRTLPSYCTCFIINLKLVISDFLAINNSLSIIVLSGGNSFRS